MHSTPEEDPALAYYVPRNDDSYFKLFPRDLLPLLANCLRGTTIDSCVVEVRPLSMHNDGLFIIKSCQERKHEFRFPTMMTHWRNDTEERLTISDRFLKKAPLSFKHKEECIFFHEAVRIKKARIRELEPCIIKD